MKTLFVLLRAHSQDDQPFRVALVASLNRLNTLSHHGFVHSVNFIPFSALNFAELRNNIAISVWFSNEQVLKVALQVLQPALSVSKEYWRIWMEPVKIEGQLAGFQPTLSEVAPLDNNDPIAVLIWGILTPAGTEPFYAVANNVVEQAHRHPDYLGGVFLTETGTETGAFSFWRTKRGAAIYAFGSGYHRDAMNAERTATWHKPEEDFFVRFRLLATDGSLYGSNPLASILPTQLGDAGHKK